MIEIVIYSKADCPLCDEARQLLTFELGSRRYRLQEVDIESDPQLLERFRYEIPVVRIDGKIRFRGLIEPVLLRRLLRARDRDRF